jgi:hypothetical protein
MLTPQVRSAVKNGVSGRWYDTATDSTYVIDGKCIVSFWKGVPWKAVG